MTDGPDPERLLAEALRAQAASTPLPPPSPLAGPLPVDEPSNTGDKAAADKPAKDESQADKPDEPAASEVRAAGPAADEEPAGGDARLVELLAGSGHGLLSGRDPGTVNLPYVGVPTNRTGPVGTTKLDSGRPQLAWWWMLLLAIVLGLAAGAVAGVLTLV